jgi:hypothetical protein
MFLLLNIALGVVLGLGIGLAFFAHLRRAAFTAVREGRALSLAGGTLLRISGTVLAFFLLTKLGAAATLAGLAGFTAARVIAVARQREAGHGR